MMTQQQFILWLEGFLDGKESQDNPSLEKIREKFNSIQGYNTHPPYVDGKGHPNPYYYTTTTAIVDSTPTSEKKLLTENED